MTGGLEKTDKDYFIIDAKFMRGYFLRTFSQLRIQKTLAIRIFVDMGAVTGSERALVFAKCFLSSMNNLDTGHGLLIHFVLVTQLGMASASARRWRKHKSPHD